MARGRQALTPLLFGLLPTLTLLSMNIESIAPVYAIRPALITTALALLAYVLIDRLLKDPARAATAVALMILLLTHSLVGESIRRAAWWDGAGALGSTAEFLWVAAMLLGFGLILSHRIPPAGLGSTMAILGIGLVVVPVLQILAYERALGRPFTLPGAPDVPRPPSAASERLPDIYYIILDGYGRQDALLDLYGLDNTVFLAELESRGFFVAHQSQSNYAQTALSLASSLNMTDLKQVAAVQGEDCGDQRPIARLIRHSALRTILEDRGYAIKSVSSGYRRTEIEDAATLLRPPIRAVNGFETQVIESMGLSPIVEGLVALGWLTEYPGYQDQRDRIAFAFSHIQGKDTDVGPQFVFAHILLPHPPFIWNAAGDAVSPDVHFRWDDASNFPGTREEYIAGYRDQLQHTNTLILEQIDQLLADPQHPLLIVLQGDHGPGSRLDWDNPQGSYLPERMGILNAYYAPAAANALYDSISPVNSFRVLLNAYLGFELPLLSDQSWFSSWEKPYTLLEVPNAPAE